MKIIEAMKQIKRLREKTSELGLKIQQHCADLDFETPVYPNQKQQVDEWLQSNHDSFKEILRLRVAIQKTNIMTPVTIELGGQQVTHSIAEWIHRRRDLAQAEMNTWKVLTDRNLKEGQIQPSVPGGPVRDVKIRRYYDPQLRDAKVALFREEPSIIDGTLEVVNATTDLIES